jgi:sugar-specific transcriptional regulator TrmB
LTSPKISVSTILRSKEEHENFHNLNSEFSERMGKFSNNSAETSSVISKESNVLNENKKCIVTHQGTREDSDDDRQKSYRAIIKQN